MYKISDEVINFIVKLWKPGKWNWQQEWEVKVQIGIFQGDALSLLLFINAMMPLHHTLRQYTARYKLRKLQEKTNLLIYMDDIKLFEKIKKELETLIHTLRI